MVFAGDFYLRPLRPPLPAPLFPSHTRWPSVAGTQVRIPNGAGLRRAPSRDLGWPGAALRKPEFISPIWAGGREDVGAQRPGQHPFPGPRSSPAAESSVCTLCASDCAPSAS